MWTQQLLSFVCLYLPFSLIPTVIILIVGVAWSTYRLYYQDLDEVLKHYRTPRHGHRAMDDKPFRRFLAQCRKRWYYHMLSSLSIVLAVTVNLNLEAAQVDIQKHAILQILAVLSMTQSLTGLYLSLLYMDVTAVALMTYGRTLGWVEGAIVATESCWLNTAIVMATPTVWTASAIITFSAYRIASGVLWMKGPEDSAWTQSDGTQQGMAVASVLYMLFVIAHTVCAAKVFQGMKDYAGPIPQIGS